MSHRSRDDDRLAPDRRRDPITLCDIGAAWIALLLLAVVVLILG